MQGADALAPKVDVESGARGLMNPPHARPPLATPRTFPQVVAPRPALTQAAPMTPRRFANARRQPFQLRQARCPRAVRLVRRVRLVLLLRLLRLLRLVWLVLRLWLWLRLKLQLQARRSHR